jgi:uncharacterized cupin superfamily protein
MAYRLLRSATAHWRPSNLMKIENCDVARPLGAEHIGARYWRLAPGQASTRHRHMVEEELYVLLEGSGRILVDGDVLELAPLDAVLVTPESVRQIYNDTAADQLWLVAGAPRDAGSSAELTPEQREHIYPDGPHALPPGFAEAG